MQADRVASRERETMNEDARLAALASAGILDSEPESSFDAVTRLCAEYFHADTVLLGFADASRFWVKSYWGEPVRELPRKASTFDLVLSASGPVVIPDVTKDQRLGLQHLTLRRLRVASLASVPVRCAENNILGTLTIFGAAPRRAMALDQLRMLESMADMVASLLELRRLQNNFSEQSAVQAQPRNVRPAWPLKQDLCRALDRREFVLHYQPEIDLATGAMIGLEALIRWDHPERGLVLPAEFIPTAEENGMILAIGDWGLEEVCAQIQRWSQSDPHFTSLRVCINLSARQFARDGLADHVEALLRQAGVSSHQLGLEMTESSLIPNAGTGLEVLSSLRRLGVSLHMDDFGTGYSSLSYLHSFPIDALKIHRSFVHRMTEGEQPLQIVRTIVELARALGISVIAEGIETCQQYALLREMGCRFGQGYLFARPMTAAAISELLSQPKCLAPCSGGLRLID